MNNLIFAIDPGTTESGYVIYNTGPTDRGSGKVTEKGKINNRLLLELLPRVIKSIPEKLDRTTFAIEMVQSYGMAVGQEVFDTCVWIGRFHQEILNLLIPRVYNPQGRIKIVFRKEIKLHHCNSVRAKDAEICQVLKSRYAYGVPNHGKGTKKNPGFFYGFKSDIWQAFALAAYIAETQYK